MLNMASAVFHRTSSPRSSNLWIWKTYYEAREMISFMLETIDAKQFALGLQYPMQLMNQSRIRTLCIAWVYIVEQSIGHGHIVVRNATNYTRREFLMPALCDGLLRAKPDCRTSFDNVIEKWKQMISILDSLECVQWATSDNLLLIVCLQIHNNIVKWLTII